MPDSLPTTPNSSSFGWEVVDVAPELNVVPVAHAEAVLSRATTPANSSTVMWYWADFGNVTVMCPPVDSACTFRAETTRTRSPAPASFWSRSIEYAFPPVSVTDTAPVIADVELNRMPTSKESPAATWLVAVSVALVEEAASVALATRPTYEVPVAARAAVGEIPPSVAAISVAARSTMSLSRPVRRPCPGHTKDITDRPPQSSWIPWRVPNAVCVRGHAPSRPDTECKGVGPP